MKKIVITAFCITLYFTTQAQWSGTGPVHTTDSVGIGTNTPDAELDVDGTVFIERGGELNFATGATKKAGIKATNVSPYDELQFYTGDYSESMRLTASGNVGIGISSPTSHLHVKGNSNSDEKLFMIESSRTTNNINRLFMAIGHLGDGQYSNGYGVLGAYYTDDTRVDYVEFRPGDIKFNEALSIGNGVPIRSTTDQGGSNIRILEYDNDELIVGSMGSGPYATGFQIGDNTVDYNWRITGGTTLMTLKGDGKLGLGVSAPESHLHVKGDASSNEELLLIESSRATANFNKLFLGIGHGSQTSDGYGVIGTYNISGTRENHINFLSGNNVRFLSKQTFINNVGIWSTTTQATGSGQIPILNFNNANELIVGPNQSGAYATAFMIGDNTVNYDWYVRDGNEHLMRLSGDGKLSLGTTTIPTDYLMAVDGKAIFEGVSIELSENWAFPDYVFEENYELRSPEELQEYIKKNKHLPNIPSAKEVEKEGMDLEEMNIKLLEKVEELTLYMLRQEERIKELESSIKK